jgi:hypothetical protein
MAAFAATDVTVTIVRGGSETFAAGQKRTVVTIAFGDASLTYATGGVPMPAVTAFGMGSAIDIMMIQQPVSPLLQYRYDKANNKMVILDEDNTSGILAELANGTAPAAVTLTAYVIGI